MADEEELSRSEALAKRAMELAARAEDLARHAHEVAGVDEQLASLEAELDALAAEEDALAAEEDGLAEGARTGPGPAPDDEPSGFGGHDDWVNWAETFSDRLEALGARIGDLVAGSVDSALAGAQTGTGEPGAVRFTREGEAEWPAPGPVPVQIRSHGGSVEVRGSDQDGIRVTWRARSWGGRYADQQPVTISERGGTVVIEYQGRRGWRAAGVSVEVELPRHSPIEVTTGGGSIQIEGTDAAVSCRTGGGSITVTEVDGEVRASTGGGGIRVEGRISGDSQIQTGGGSIDVIVEAGTQVDVDVSGTKASVDVPSLKVEGYHVVGPIDGGGGGRLRVRTGGGSARIRQR
ncbi:MAG TPA: hypothetical protein VG435_06960 [Acidimicrobiales bacterium]|jgi:hypothetical protein|nr:hypothetical protein [Acidimicrobiales bacterium]